MLLVVLVGWDGSCAMCAHGSALEMLKHYQD
jgi:hypothetical protein